MAAQSHARIREVNAIYHDAAAATYDSKWGIDFGGRGRVQTLRKVEKVLGSPAGHFGQALEIGSGTGYFSLNLMLAGMIDHTTATDVSGGMLEQLAQHASRLGLDVRTVVGDAERLPLEDASFDLVLGHAVLHHLPDLDRSFGEFFRLLRPGGVILFAGEPSRYGNALARVPKQAARAVAPLWRRALRASPSKPPEEHGHEFEHVVDIHTFSPPELSALAREAGFEQIRVRGEELLANWFGWTNRVLEATAEPDEVPLLWRKYAYRGYLALQEVDRLLFEPRLPAGLFYNLLLAARKPAA